MLIPTVFIIITLSHALTCMLNYRAGILLFLFLYPIYPRFFALGVSSEGFALTGQRVMIFVLAGFYILRFLWGSAEVRKGLESLQQFRGLYFAIGAIILFRLAGNVFTARVDVGAVAALVGETLISIFIFLLVVTYVRTKREIGILLSILVTSLLISQLAATVEFFQAQTLFPQDIDIQYETQYSDEALLEGRSRDDIYRARAFFDNPLELAGLIILLLPLAIANMRIAPTLTQRAMSCLAIFLAVPVAVFTGSRTAMGCSLGIIAWYLYTAVSKGMSRMGKLFLAFSVGGLGVVAIASLGSGLVERSLFTGRSGTSAAYRVIQYGLSAEALTESPVFGFGFARNIGDIVNIIPLDSFYLRMTLEGGIAALISLFMVYYFCFSILKTPIADTSAKYFKSFNMALRVSLTVSAIAALVLSFPSDRLYLYLIMGLCVVYGRLNLDTKRPIAATSP